MGATWGAGGEDGEGLEYFGFIRVMVLGVLGRRVIYYLPTVIGNTVEALSLMGTNFS